MGRIILQKIKQWNTQITNNDVTIISEKEKVACYLYLLSTFTGFFCGMKVLEMFFSPVDMALTARMVEWSSVGMLVIYILFTPLKLHRSGVLVTFSEMKKTLLHCGFLSALILLSIFPIRFIMRMMGDEITVIPPYSIQKFILREWYYPFVVILQEFLSKSLLQEKTKELLGPGHVHAAILSCGMTFFLFHFGYPLYFMIGAAIIAIITGYIYETERNIWGCVIVHYVITFYGFCMMAK